MIEQNARVVRCAERRIWVRMGSQSGCKACDNGEGCGAGVFAKLLMRKPAVIELPRQNTDVKAGQMVTLAFPEKVYLKMVLSHYGWPLIAALLGASAAYVAAAWLQLGTVLLDICTLLGGITAGSITMRFFRSKESAQAVLNSLKLAVYYPSATPNMCSAAVNEPEKD